MSGSGISWAICMSAPRSRQITTTVPHHSVFYRPDALPVAQPTASKHWRQSVWVWLEFRIHLRCQWIEQAVDKISWHTFAVFTLCVATINSVLFMVIRAYYFCDEAVASVTEAWLLFSLVLFVAIRWTQLNEHVRTQVLTPQCLHLFNTTTYETTHLLLHVLIYLQFRSGRLCSHTRYPGATKTYLNVL